MLRALPIRSNWTKRTYRIQLAAQRRRSWSFNKILHDRITGRRTTRSWWDRTSAWSRPRV